MSTSSEHPQQPGPGLPPPPPGRPDGPPPGVGPSGGYGGSPAYGAPGGPPPHGYGPAPVLSPADQRTWAALAHVGGIFFSIVPALVVWLVLRGRGAYVEDQAKEALNFQIALAIAFLVGGVLSLVGIGVLILLVAWVGGIVLAILAAVAASRGEPYRYPVNLRLVT